MFPDRLRRVILPRALSQNMRVSPAPLLTEPSGNLSIPVVGGAIVNIMHRTRVVDVGHLFQEMQIRFGVEDRLVVKQEACRVDLETAENLDTVARARRRHAWSTAPPCPGLVYRAVLTEAVFVLKHKHPVWG